MSILLSDFEYLIQNNVRPLDKSLGFHSQCAQTLAEGPSSMRQMCQKVLLCRHFGGLSPLDFGH